MRVRTLLARSATFLLAAFAVYGSTVDAQGAERVALRGSSIAVYNLVGRLQVRGGGNSATATVTRRGRDAGRLTIATGQVNGSDALRIVYPDDEITVPDLARGRYRTELRVRDDGTFGDDNGRSRRWNEGRRVRISNERGGLEAAADIDLQVPDGVSLRVHLAMGEAVINNIAGNLWVDVSGADVTVTDVKGTLSLDTGSGKATVTNVEGAMEFDTGSGDFVGKNLRGPVLSVDSGSGDVTIDGCSVDKASIDTGSGSLHVTGLRARSLSMDTGSGDVQVELLSNIDVLTVDSGSGNVTLTMPPSFAATLDIDTGSGRVDSDFPIQLTSRSRDVMRGHIGTGGGRVTIETGSGNVRIRKGAGN